MCFKDRLERGGAQGIMPGGHPVFPRDPGQRGGSPMGWDPACFPFPRDTMSLGLKVAEGFCLEGLGRAVCSHCLPGFH